MPFNSFRTGSWSSHHVKLDEESGPQDRWDMSPVVSKDSDEGVLTAATTPERRVRSLDSPAANNSTSGMPRTGRSLDDSKSMVDQIVEQQKKQNDLNNLFPDNALSDIQEPDGDDATAEEVVYQDLEKQSLEKRNPVTDLTDIKEPDDDDDDHDDIDEDGFYKDKHEVLYNDQKHIQNTLPVDEEDKGKKMPDDKQPDSNKHHPLRRRYLLLTSNLLFVLGSVLYFTMAVEDLKWAQEAKEIPSDVLYADDDFAWVQFRQTENTLAPTVTPPAWTSPAISSTSTTASASSSRASDNHDENRIRKTRKLTTYDDYGWAELPATAQYAAQVLGYDETSWDGSAEVATSDMWWHELTPAQQQAAGVLGYNQFLWDGVDLATTIMPTAIATVLPIVAVVTPEQMEDDSTDPMVNTPAPSFTNNNENTGDASTTNTETANAATPTPTATTTASNNNENVQDATTPNTANDNNDASTSTSNNEDTEDASPANDNDTDATTTTPEPATTPTPPAPVTEDQATAPLVEWELYSWEDMPPEVRLAYTVLGYDKTLWKYKGGTSTSDLQWEELTPTKQAAALSLGYTQAIWNDNLNQASTTAASSSIVWEIYEWDDMPLDVRLAYTTLGYDKTIWANGDEASTSDLSWEELNPTEQAAAAKLGYTQPIWDGVLEPTITTTTTAATTTTTTTAPIIEDPAAKWYDYWWRNLPAEIQEAYTTLGYNEEMWDNEITAATDDMDWEELTPDQQEAAGLLGYNQAIWDGAVVAEPYISEDDDYVFSVGRNDDVWVSRYMILYFCAALCFVLVGMVDYVREHRLFHLSMILAGLFGMVSAMLLEKDRTVSMVFNLLSVHFYLLEGFNVMRWHIQARMNNGSFPQSGDDIDTQDDESEATDSDLSWITTLALVADFCFVLGAFMDVILSYFYFDRSSDWNLAIARVFGFSMLLWILCAFLYLLVTLVVEFGWLRGEEKPTNMEIEPTNKAIHRTDTGKSSENLC